MGDWILSTAEGIAPGGEVCFLMNLSALISYQKLKFLFVLLQVSAVLSNVRRRVRKIRRSGERMTGAFR